MLDEREHAARDRVARRLVAGHEQQEEEGVEVDLGELLALDLGLEEHAHHVVARAPAVFGGELVRVHVDLRRGGLAGFVRPVAVLRVVEADHRVAPIEDLVPILGRHAHHLDDHLERQLGGDVGHEVALAARRNLVDDPVRDLAHAVLEPVGYLGREAEVHEAAVLRVAGRVHVDHQGLVRRELLLGPVPEDRTPPRGREGLRVERHVPDVAVTRQGPEPVAVTVTVPVPEERGLAAEELEGLVRRAGREEVGVGEVDVRESHGAPPQRPGATPRSWATAAFKKRRWRATAAGVRGSSSTITSSSAASAK